MLKKWFTLLLVAFLWVSIFPSSSLAAGSVKNHPVHLKLNDYYVLYTHPKPPYLDQQNRLIVPLRAVSELLGASVAYDHETRTATIKDQGHTIKLTIGSKTAIVNDQEVQMDTVAVEENGSMFVPLRILIDTFRLEYHISPYGIVEVRGDGILSRGQNLYFEETISARGWTLDKHAFVQLSFSYDMTRDEESLLPDRMKISVRLKNVTGEDIPERYEDVHIMFMNNTGTLSQRDVERHLRYRPAIAKDEIFEKTEESGGMQHIRYVLLLGRTITSHPLDYLLPEYQHLNSQKPK